MNKFKIDIPHSIDEACKIFRLLDTVEILLSIMGLAMNMMIPVIFQKQRKFGNVQSILVSMIMKESFHF